jgi:hypothetical protein
VTEEKVRRFVNERLGIPNPSAFTLFAPPDRAVVVVVESEKRDRVVDELLDTLKYAAKGQFSGGRAAVLVVQFLELDADAILAIARRDSTDRAQASALQIATNKFFESPARSHNTHRRLPISRNGDDHGAGDSGARPDVRLHKPVSSARWRCAVSSLCRQAGIILSEGDQPDDTGHRGYARGLFIYSIWHRHSHERRDGSRRGRRRCTQWGPSADDRRRLYSSR